MNIFKFYLRNTRLGKNGAEEIKAHPYFTNHNEWTWETIRQGNDQNKKKKRFN